MAEILFPLTAVEAYPYQPMRELLPDSRREVYAVVGEYLEAKTSGGEELGPEVLLVRLDSGTEVVFDGLGSISMEESEITVSSEPS